MSYQVLARKWRPKSFQELMGQEHVVTVLTNALAQNRLHHAYLFTGTRGVGKTTIARIFAKSLNCQQGVTATPCGQCDVCQDIDQGRFVDLLEIDAASRTKVDDTREILDNVQYAPSRGRFKVYLIDEVHMLSRSSFNALLKTLEEPPAHVKFILATTDPQKLPITVLSRCLQFHLKALMVEQIATQLKKILTAEAVSFEESAITLLAKAARGSVRDSLSLTDQAIAQGQGTISLANVRHMLGGVDDNWTYKILINLIKQDSAALMTLSSEIASYAPNYSRLMAELIQLLHQVALLQVTDRHFDVSPEQAELLNKFAQAMSAEDIQLYYQIALTSRKDLPYASDEQSAFEMLLLRLLAFKPQTSANANANANAEQEIVEKAAVDFDTNELPDTNVAFAESKTDSESNVALEPLQPKPVQQSQEQAVQDEHLQTSVETPSLAIAPKVDQPCDDSEVSTQLNQEMFAIEQQAQMMTNEALLADSGQEDLLTTQAPITGPVNYIQGEQASTANEALASESVQKQPESIETVSIEQETKTVLSSESVSPIDNILANRNMLRSRKKALESEGKKSDDANVRQQGNTEQAKIKQRPAHVPEIESLPEQGFTPEVINPEKIRFANQVDRWANMIDTMELGGRLKVLASNSTICPTSTEDTWVFKLNQTVKHLKSEAAHRQLEDNLSELLAQKVTIVLDLVEETKDDPYQIQSQINDKRYQYAKQVIENDEIVISMKQQFQATVDESTIEAR